MPSISESVKPFAGRPYIGRKIAFLKAHERVSQMMLETARAREEQEKALEEINERSSTDPESPDLIEPVSDKTWGHIFKVNFSQLVTT